jgi:hypothetical protein
LAAPVPVANISAGPDSIRAISDSSENLMRKRIPLLIVTACSVLSLVTVLFVVNTDQKDQVVLDQLNPFGSVEDVTLPMQVCSTVAA